MHTFMPFEQRISNTAGTFLTNDWNYRPQLLLFKDTRHKLDDYLGWPGYQSAAQAGCREANATYIQSEDKNTSIPPFSSDLNWDDYDFHDDKAGIKQQKRSNMIHVIPKDKATGNLNRCVHYIPAGYIGLVEEGNQGSVVKDTFHRMGIGGRDIGIHTTFSPKCEFGYTWKSPRVEWLNVTPRQTMFRNRPTSGYSTTTASRGP